MDNEDSVIPTLIYPEDSDNEDSPINPPYMEPTSETGPPSKKPSKETTLEPDYDALPEPSASKREGSMGHLVLKYIVRF